ncbi:MULTISPECIES: Tat proofreading chaperone DmsD [unclassified Brenneria]|uniref:Tat proofreading chaperone DmsD n=1 Tax=unclassified Brenneria TaxID=2634434 RepID=UPI001551C1BA|nr:MULTISPECIES: Tat proofreading chaperone DmsD [unclassified Brenneria]MBJ7221309.1 Tat proofreading chaperone DmsD [Brenneria sp. L3-3C-1]MEE3642553.1 Tat proofreading chaperone DmsD [Brenneria sp. L3_3C_1]MEE3650075.1 Tat proofreading chaperone DmsD [Brenneria sp. HEZEL_4_2_4]NPD00034.1 Tat proofreading chaperone DmsD [Brenneria sp. hezel4-2-4]
MSSVAVLPRLLGALFYYPPDSPEISRLIDSLDQIPDLYPWHNRASALETCQQCRPPAADEFIWQFSALFEGQGEMQAPPWGSVYLDRDNLLMGDSTARYREFLRQHQLAFARPHHEPEDQFGLMLLALACLLEQENEKAALALLEEHLLPWSDRYLALLARNTQSVFYARLARIAALFLQDIQRRYRLTPREYRIYR